MPSPNEKTKTAAFIFAGTNGATSLKEELIGRVPVLKDASGYREARRLLRQELGGWETVYEELRRSGFVDGDTHQLTTGSAPFNVFARIAAGKMTQPGEEREQGALGEYKEKFMVCKNRPENDEHWDSPSPEWVGKASMSRRHKFLILKDLHWQWFNPLVFGTVPQAQGGDTLDVAIAFLELMKAAALTYTANKGGWSQQVGLFFHVFGHNSVNSMHMHIVDMAELGPTFWKLEYKNCPLDDILRVLREEREAAKKNGTSGEAAVEATLAAKQAAASANAAMQQVKEMVRIHGSRRSSKGQMQLVADDDFSESIIQLNVGGELVAIPHQTTWLAPEDSYFRFLFKKEYSDLHKDSSGRLFLNFPPRSFKLILDHLRLIHITHPSDTIKPIAVPAESQYEVEELAWLLGLGDLLTKPQSGKAFGTSKREGPRPKVVATRGERSSWLDRFFGRLESSMARRQG